jgi:hypothetical protein
MKNKEGVRMRIGGTGMRTILITIAAVFLATTCLASGFLYLKTRENTELQAQLTKMQNLRLFNDLTELEQWINKNADKLGNLPTESIDDYVRSGLEIQQLAANDGYFISLSVSDLISSLGSWGIFRVPIVFTSNPKDFYFILYGKDKDGKAGVTVWRVGDEGWSSKIPEISKWTEVDQLPK